MRIRPSIVRALLWMLVPAAFGLSAYFGYYALYSDHGYVELLTVRGELVQANSQLAQLSGEHQRLEHRIALLQSGDADLIEELARDKLMNGAPGQVAIPRQRQ